MVVGPPVTNKKDGYTEAQLMKYAKDFDAIIGMSREKFTKEVLNSSIN